MRKKYNEDIQLLLKTVVDVFDAEDDDVRERQIIAWKRLELMWEGFHNIWWSEVAHDWRVYSENGSADNQAAYYDKPINIYRAYLETIIAAMSAGIPTLIGLPDDADNISDCLTAKAATKISELVYKHNDAPLLWMHALFIFVTQGMIAAYNYTDENETYGTVEQENYKEVEEEAEDYICPLCKMPLEGAELESAIQAEIDSNEEFGSNESEDEIEAANLTLCPNCQMQIAPEQSKRKILVKKFVGITNKAKTRQCIECYGGLYVKIPVYAKKQKDIPYLKFMREQHYSQIYKDYPWLRDKEGVISSTSQHMYEVWGRISPQYMGTYPKDTPTVNKWWFRPSAFNVISDDADREKLLKLFPKGVHVTYINECYACAEPESLDDHWTITENPLSEYVHFNPMGELLVSVQEITNDLISLILQTIEHGIPQTFADPTVLNFEAYRNTEATPGQIFQAKPKSGKSLTDAFYTTKTATLSQEVMPFGEKIQELGQFTSGALPSLYGGDQSNSSRTAAQYQMSKQSSMQRLQIAWKMLNFWWKGIFSKVVPAYIETILEDEHLVEYKQGTYINTIIRKSELEGNLGSIELESSDQLPFTYGQKRDAIVNLMQSTNPAVLAALGHPDNLPLIAEALGLVDFTLPGESDREKQQEEIQLLMQSIPMPGPEGQEVPSVMPDFELDNNEIESEVCRSWLISEPGRQAKKINPDGYRNVLLHMKFHAMAAASQEMQETQTPEEGETESPAIGQKMETS